MARKLEAQFAGRYLMPSVLMTSTMKSDPGMPLTRASSRGVPVSASAAFPEGGRAEGARGACATTSAERAGGLIADAAVAAPAATTPVRNLRRSAFGPGSLRAMVFSSSCSSPGGDCKPARIVAPRVREVRGVVPSGGKPGDHLEVTNCDPKFERCREKGRRRTPLLCSPSKTWRFCLRSFAAIGNAELQLDAFVRDDALHRRALRHAVLEGGVMLQLRHGQLALQAPGVEHQGIGVEHRILVGQPLAPRVHRVDLLQVFVEALLPHRLDAGEGRLVLGIALGPADVAVRGMHARGEKADDG